MELKQYQNLKKIDFSEVEWSISNSLRAFCTPDELFMSTISVAALIYLNQKYRNDSKSLSDIISEIIHDEATAYYLNSVARKHGNTIYDMNNKFNNTTLLALILFAEFRQSRMGAWTTPSSIIDLALKILEVKPTDHVVDFCSGLGSFLMESFFQQSKAKHYGVELNSDCRVISVIRCIMMETTIEIRQGNVLSQTYQDLQATKLFSNYPIGQGFVNVKREIEENEELRKIFNSAKRTISTDWIYNMALVSNMSESGRSISLMSNSGTWNESDIEIRSQFIQKGLIEGVISLPERLFDFTSIGMTMIIFSHNNDKIKLVDAGKIFHSERRQNYLNEDDVNKILSVYGTESGISTVVSEDVLEKDGYILNPMRYIEDGIEIENGIRFEKICKSISRGSQIKSSKFDELATTEKTGYHYLMLQNIQDGFIDDELPSLKELDEKLDRYCIKNNDLILSKIGQPFKVALAKVDCGEKILANGNLYFIELDTELVNPIYVKVFLESEVGIASLKKLARGTVMKTISIRDLNSLIIPMLTKEEQDKIAEKYQELCDEIKILDKQREMVRNELKNLLNK